MSNTEKTLSALHEMLAQDLLTRVESGNATAAELAVAMKFLKDNGIEVGIHQDNSPLTNLAKVLPFKDPDIITDAG